VIGIADEIVTSRDPSLRATGKYRGISFTAITWNTTTIGVELGNPSDTIRSMVKDLVDEFINAYLAAKQKSQ